MITFRKEKFQSTCDHYSLRPSMFSALFCKPDAAKKFLDTVVESSQWTPILISIGTHLQGNMQVRTVRFRENWTHVCNSSLCSPTTSWKARHPAFGLVGLGCVRHESAGFSPKTEKMKIREGHLQRPGNDYHGGVVTGEALGSFDGGWLIRL